MANAYLVGIYNKIIDQEKLQKYAVDALPAMMANGGKKALARSANITQIEGIPPERAVILEFESVETAKNAYNSEDYQAALMSQECIKPVAPRAGVSYFSFASSTQG